MSMLDDILSNAESKRAYYREILALGIVVVKQRWERVRDDDLSSALLELRAITTVSDLSMDRVPYPGTWNVIDIETGPLKTDPSVQGIVRTLAKNIGPHVVAFVGEQSCMGLTSSAAYSGSAYPISAPANSRGVTFQASSSFDPETGTYSGSIIRHDDRPKDFSFRSARSARSLALEYGYRRRDDPLDAPDLSIPGSTSSGFSLNDACTYDGQIRADFPVPAAWHRVSQNALEQSTEVAYDDYADRPSIPPNRQGILVDASEAYTEQGAWRTRLKLTESSDHRFSFSSFMSSRRQALNVEYAAARDPFAPAVIPAGGGIWRTNMAYRPDGTYSGSIGYEGPGQPRALAWMREANAEGVDHAYAYLDYAAPVPLPAGRQGLTARVAVSETDAGSYNTSLDASLSTPTVFSFSSFMSSRRQALNVEYAAARDSFAPAVIPAGGGIWRTNMAYRPDGTYSGSIGYEGPGQPRAIEWVAGRTALDTTHAASYRDYAAPIATPIPAIGQTVRASVSESDTGAYATDLTVGTSAPMVFSFARYISPRRIALSHEYLAQRTPFALTSVPVGAGGRSQDVAYQEDGTYRGRIGREYELPSSVAFVARDDAFETLYVYEESGQASPAAAPGVSTGFVDELSESWEFDDTYKRRRTASRAKPTLAAVKFPSNGIVHNLYEYKNWPTVPDYSELDPFDVNVVSITPRRDRTYDVRISQSLTRGFSIGGRGDAWKTGTIDFSFRERQSNTRYYVYVKFTTSTAIAQSHLQTYAAYDIVDGAGGWHTGPWTDHAGRIMAVRVEEGI